MRFISIFIISHYIVFCEVIFKVFVKKNNTRIIESYTVNIL